MLRFRQFYVYVVILGDFMLKQKMKLEYFDSSSWKMWNSFFWFFNNEKCVFKNSVFVGSRVVNSECGTQLAGQSLGSFYPKMVLLCYFDLILSYLIICQDSCLDFVLLQSCSYVINFPKLILLGFPFFSEHEF